MGPRLRRLADLGEGCDLLGCPTEFGEDLHGVLAKTGRTAPYPGGGLRKSRRMGRSAHPPHAGPVVIFDDRLLVDDLGIVFEDAAFVENARWRTSGRERVHQLTR